MPVSTARDAWKGSRSSRSRHVAYAMIGALGGLVAASVLVASGIELGRMFGDRVTIESPARVGDMHGSLHPCGANVSCFEKSRYRPVWL